MIKKITAINLLFCLVLTACSASNPLDKKSPSEAARLLSSASQTAMKRLGFELRAKERYAQCMEHITNPFFNCENLYQTMTKVLVEQGVAVREKDIVDEKIYARIKNELKLQSYF